MKPTDPYPVTISVNKDKILFTFVSQQAAQTFCEDQDLDPKINPKSDGHKFSVTDYIEWYVTVPLEDSVRHFNLS